MNRLPAVGERVRYRKETEWWTRECTGTVRKLYPGYYGESLRVRDVGSRDWADHWSASVEVDEPLPDWWPYARSNRFAPAIGDLAPLSKGEGPE